MSVKLPIYFDYSATTPVDPRVVDAMVPWLYEKFGNPASRSHSFGWEAEEAVEQARQQVADLIGADSREIIWTSGATESDNLAIKGVAEFYQSRGKHLITVKTEHKAVLDPMRELEREGFEVTYLDVQSNGLIDLEELKANLPYKTYEKRKEENPNQPVEKITIVCMGHEPDLKAALEAELSGYNLDIQIVDILRDKADIQLKREAEAEIVRDGDKLVIRAFYPMNLMQKLSLQKEYVEDWRQLVESIMIDWNYDGVVLQPTITDVPGKNEMVLGIYDIPEDAGTIKVKITDLLSESLEMEV